MKKYLQLLRVKHYIKNLLVLVPLFFGQGLFELSKLKAAGMGIFSFCMISSAVYIINDWRDIEKDRNHSVKKNRPLASGAVSKPCAGIFMGLCLALSVIPIIAVGGGTGSLLYILIYFLINVAYSFGLKNIPIVDIVILASGFVLRILCGGYLTNVTISSWLYLMIVTGSLYMGLGKRRNELKKKADTRNVLKYYTESFLDKNMYVCMALVDVFYALWSIEISNPYMKWTVPLFIIIMMRYSYDVEGDSDGDPVEVVLQDKWLLILAMFYILCISVLLYCF